jgi:hypothetical protein
VSVRVRDDCLTRRVLKALCIATALTLVHLLGACGTGHEYSGPLPSPDGQAFVDDVYPLLLRDCAFVTCHGATDRFFQVFGPGRARLDPSKTKPDDRMTFAEVQHSYQRALSMLTTADQLDRSLLLNKPLEPSAGGQGHTGVDDLGRNVFASTDTPGYVLLKKWASSNGLPPTAAQVDAAQAATEMAPEASQ